MKSLVFSSLTAVRQGRKGYGIRYQPSTAKVRYARSASCLRHIAYSDFWEADHRVLPSKRHRAVGKESGQTNHIERFNCTLGQRISRLVRKTLSFSKKLENHIGAIGVLCSPLQCILTCVGLPPYESDNEVSEKLDPEVVLEEIDLEKEWEGILGDESEPGFLLANAHF